jgi:hypothetical protein
LSDHQNSKALFRGGSLTQKYLKNIPASVRQRLLNKAREDNRSFEEIVKLYAMERFLYRLSNSKHRTGLILKGALMLRVWLETINRPTMDIDALGKMSNDAATLEKCIKEIYLVTVEPDGLVFDPESIVSDDISKGTAYIGRRIRFIGHLENMRIPMQMDIGFGDSIFPAPLEVTIPSMLGFPSPIVIGYTKESSIAEKFHAMVEMGELNSRMKDFYDIWLLSMFFDFNGEVMANAVLSTFGKRSTPVDQEISAFTETFAAEKQIQWNAFRKKLNSGNIPDSFYDVVKPVKAFLMPIIRSLAVNKNAPLKWIAPGPWKYRKDTI